MKRFLTLLLFALFSALGLSAQTPIGNQHGIVPVHNLRIEDSTYWGQLIGIWEADSGDTLFGFVPVYVLPDSTLLVGSDTVYSSGNPQVITLSGDVTGTGTSSIVTNIAAGAVGATELQSTAVTPGSYTLSSLTVDADGRLTAASSGTVNLASQVTGTLPVANGGTGTATALTQGSVVFAGASGTYSQNNSNFFWNNSNNRLGIGTTSPATALHVVGNITSPGSGSLSEKFGASSEATVQGLAVGNSAKANAASGYATAIGTNAVASNTFAVALGNGATASGSLGFALGYNAVASGNTSIAIGANTNNSLANTIMFGGGSGAWINTMILGMGNTATTASSFGSAEIRTTNASGTDNAGSNLTLTAGRSTGSATSGFLDFQTGGTGSTGSTLNSASSRMRIISGGNVGIATTSPTNTLDVNGTARIRNFTGTPTRLIGADGTGVLDTLVIGSGLTLSGGTLSASGGSGTVSSVGLTMPTGFTVSGSPITTSGTLAVTTTLNGPLRGNGSGFTTGNTNLASEVTGTLPVANGGTGATTLTANKVLVGNGTSAVLNPTNLHWDNTNSRLGISETSPAYPLDINATTAIRLPRGTDAQQPAAAAGLLRYSSTTNTVNWSDGTNWQKAIAGEGQGPASGFNRVALWSGASTQTSDEDMSLNITSGQLKLLKYSSASAFAGTSVAQLHVTSTGEVITKTPRDTVYVHLVAVNPGTAVTQTAGFDFYQGSFQMPEHLNNYTLSRADYAITNSTATTGSLTVRLRYYDTTNGGGSTACAVTFTGADVRESSTNGFVVPKGYWMHAEVGSTNGNLNNTVEGLLVTLMFTK